jgi:hypothetical protein
VGISPGDEVFVVGEHEQDAPGDVMFGSGHEQPEVAGYTGAEGGMESTPSPGESGLESGTEHPSEPRFGEDVWKPATVYDEEGNTLGSTSVEVEY